MVRKSCACCMVTFVVYVTLLINHVMYVTWFIDSGYVYVVWFINHGALCYMVHKSWCLIHGS